LETNEIWANSIACTGEPHCNFSVGETKTRLELLVRHLEAMFGPAVGDLGFQATTGKDEDGNRVPAYDVFVRGSLGPQPAIGGSLFRRIPSDRLEPAVEGLVRGWLDRRTEGETFTDFQRRLSDDELGALAGLEPARKRVAA